MERHPTCHCVQVTSDVLRPKRVHGELLLPMFFCFFEGMQQHSHYIIVNYFVLPGITPYFLLQCQKKQVIIPGSMRKSQSHDAIKDK